MVKARMCELSPVNKWVSLGHLPFLSFLLLLLLSFSLSLSTSPMLSPTPKIQHLCRSVKQITFPLAGKLYRKWMQSALEGWKKKLPHPRNPCLPRGIHFRLVLDKRQFNREEKMWISGCNHISRPMFMHILVALPKSSPLEEHNDDIPTLCETQSRFAEYIWK